MVRKIVLPALAALVATGLWVLAAGSAGAQYPPNPTSAALAVDNATPSTGGSVSVAVLVLDASSAPTANVGCNFSIVSQPGTDASVSPSSGATNAQGVATTTLHVGSRPGAIVVGAQCGSAAGTVSVVASAAAAPPASLPGGPTLPASGTGPGGSSGRDMIVLVSLALLTLSGFSMFYLARRRRKHLNATR